MRAIEKRCKKKRNKSQKYFAAVTLPIVIQWWRNDVCSIRTYVYAERAGGQNYSSTFYAAHKFRMRTFWEK